MRLLTTLAATATLLAIAACSNTGGGDDVATAQSPGQPSAAANPSGSPDPRRFAACLRERGVDVADPPPGEDVEIASKDDKTRSALRACARFAPPSQQQDEGAFDPAASRAYAACVRGKGFPDFPDPDERGPRIPKDLIHDERFKAADRDCAHHLNEQKGGGK